jgi:predicted ATPase
MNDKEPFLKSINIKNLLSLRDVTISFKGLTILVGPNACGKTNFAQGLNLLSSMLYGERLPSNDYIRDIILWAGEAKNISYKLETEINQISTEYKVEIVDNPQNIIAVENLKVNKVNVISINNGEGKVTDEDGNNELIYIGVNLALKSAGNYGKKPITNALAKFIADWNIYDFDINRMLGDPKNKISFKKKVYSEIPYLNWSGNNIKDILSYFAEFDKERFDAINQSLKETVKLGIYPIKRKSGVIEFYIDAGLGESSKKDIPISGASGGTLRLLGYSVLLNSPKIPSLIIIEEPERNFHPAALKYVADIIYRLSKKTQVIITTHSSQFLNSFPDFSDDIKVIPLINKPKEGTIVLDLEDLLKNNEALDGWRIDFGIGSAIFDSGLLKDIFR